MRVSLGYVALPLSINVTSSSRITYTRFKAIDDGLSKIDSIIQNNLDSLYEILKYNKSNDIHFYRITSNLIPLATLKEVKFDYINPYLDKYKKIGKYANMFSIRIDAHPDQFCVLNSISPSVVNSSIDILKYQRKLFMAFGLINPKLILHIGSSTGGKSSGITRFINNFRTLDSDIQKMIILENDDKVFNISDVLNVSKELNIPMVLDYHHYVCNNNNESLEECLPKIFSTWDNEYFPPKVHFSSPKFKSKKNNRAHSDFIDCKEFIKFLEIAKKYTTNLDIMIEAKGKDFALFKLVRELKYKTNYEFIDSTTFIVK